VQKEGGEEEEEYDMDLSEFREELGDVLFHKFFDENYKSVRDIIQTSKEDLVNTLGIEPEKIDEIIAMLKKGFEEAEIEVDEETDALLAEIDGSRKEGKSEENTTEEKVNEEAIEVKTETGKLEGE
jgi:NTP pyrophosphatase (non-canonical NTP hydrolase)